MEFLIADLINNPKVPKCIRYAIVTVLCVFLIVVMLFAAVASPYAWGKIVCALFAVMFIVAYICLLRKIHRN